MTDGDRSRLPTYSAEASLGDRGMRFVERIVSEELKWIFHDQTRKDFGVDALLEVVRSDRRVTGRLIAAQVKCGDSWFAEPTPEGDGWIYRGDLKHLDYWLGHSLPAIVILCEPDSGRCFYAEVIESRIRRTQTGWAIKVPKGQPLDASARSDLKRMVNVPQRKDVIELALLPHLVERWGNRLTVCSVTAAPRDFHRFPYLIRIDGTASGTFGVQFIDTSVRLPNADAITEELEWLAYNERATGGMVRDLILFLVSDHPGSLQLSTSAQALVDGADRLHLHRLIYRFESFVWLDEVNGQGEPIDHTPGDDEVGY